MHTAPPFNPPWPLRYPQLQSALASFRGRNWLNRAHPVALASTTRVLDCGVHDGENVRLESHWSVQPLPAQPRGVATLIHGWEGCHESAYVVSLACRLFDAGYNVVRLNLRDHGTTHHLNEGMFHSARLGEVLGAIRAIQDEHPGIPSFVVGVSLGGNFALRVALRGAELGVRPDLCVGVCPAVDPRATCIALDEGPRLFFRYFEKKWRKTLDAKLAAWPGRYDFSNVWPVHSFLDITRQFAENHTEFGTVEDYFAQYTLGAEEINATPSPLAIIAAQDDPVVPFSGFDGVCENDKVRFLAPRHGGHAGFMQDFRMQSWAELRLLELFEQAAA